MFENVDSSQIYILLIVTGGLSVILLLYIAFKLESIGKLIEKQKELSDLKNLLDAQKAKDIKP
jgi:hypothetical protein